MNPHNETTDHNFGPPPPPPPPPTKLGLELVKTSIPSEWLDSTAPEEEFLPDVPGYVVQRRLGEGGMGTVYLARQLSLNRLTALKMLLAGAHASARQIVRFQIEAETLAGLQHPHIVQIFEIGQFRGHPFFAMEFVDGGSLDRVLGGKPQPIHESAGLIETLARAMHAAHVRGIVHRDLKPGNVLMQIPAGFSGSMPPRLGDYVAKVSDFGLAKRLEEPSTDQAHPLDATRTGVVVGTPGYMAPEQALGQIRHITPLTDVYALGVILYECLTGRPPFIDGSPVQIASQVINAEPIPPSRLRPGLPRDLGTICLKCLQKRPERRYASAEALAEDLRRFLAYEPITARPVPPLERSVKWVRRNPTWAVVLVAACVALGGGVSHTLVVQAERDRAQGERDRAERHASLALRAINKMLTEVAVEQLAYEPHMEQKRRALLRQAQELYAEMLSESIVDPDVNRHAALGYRYMADVLRQMGEYAEAEVHYDEAIVRLSSLPPEEELRRQLADAYNYRGEVFRLTSRPEQARTDYREAAQIRDQLLADNPEQVMDQVARARTDYNLGLAFFALNDRRAAQTYIRQSVDRFEELVEADPAALHRQHLARAWLNLGTVLDSLSDKEQAYETAIELLEELKADNPRKVEYQHELGVALNNLGAVFQATSDRMTEAEPIHRRAADLFRTLSDDFPSVAIYRQELANSLNSLGASLSAQERYADAVTVWEEGVAELRKLIVRSSDVADYRGDLGMALGNIASADLAEGRYQEARTHVEEGIQCLREALGANPDHPHYLDSHRVQHITLADTLVMLGAHDDACAWAQDLHDPELSLGMLARCILCEDAVAAYQERDPLTEPYLNLTATILRESLEKDSTLADRLMGDPVFAPIAERPEIRELLTPHRHPK